MIKDILDNVKVGIEYVVSGDLIGDVFDGAEEGLVEVKDSYLMALDTFSRGMRETGEVRAARVAASVCGAGATAILGGPYIALKVANAVVDGGYGRAAKTLVDIGEMPYNFFNALADKLDPRS